VLVAVGVVLIAVGALWGLLVAVAVAWLGLLVAVYVRTILRFRRARAEIRATLEQAGYQVMRMSHRYLRLGPFSVWNTSRSQFVFHSRCGRRLAGNARHGPVGDELGSQAPTLELTWEK
jgi:hypothetical protein